MNLIEEFIAYLIHEKRFSEHTVLAYQNDLNQFQNLMDLHTDHAIKEVNHQVMRAYLVALVEQELENTSINRKLSSIKTFFRYLRQQGHIDKNPTIKVKGLKQKKVLPQFVPEKQLWDASTFESASSSYNQALDELIFELFYQTGIRLSELINLKEKGVSNDCIKVLGKRNKERIIPVSKNLSALIAAFKSLKEETGCYGEYLLLTEKGKKLYPSLVYRKVNSYLGKATNLSKKSPHVLRHTFATHMLNNGASLESIKKLLGHADLSATQIYTHNSFGKIKSIYQQAHPRGGH